jgi:hypothetical protein
MNPRSFRRGDRPSLKDLQDLCVWMVKITPGRERGRGEEEEGGVGEKK